MNMKSHRKWKKQVSAIILSLLMAFTTVIHVPATIVEAAVGDGSLPDGYSLIEETKNSIAPGISDKKIVMNTDSGDKQNIVFACEVDLSKSTTGIMAGYKDYNPEEWGMQTLSEQVKKAESATNQNVVAAINADFYDMATGEPIGALVMNGKVYHEAAGRPYFAILKDGSAVIREGDVPLDDVKEAVGGGPFIVKDGQVVNYAEDGYQEIPYSRTAIGIKEDGKVVALTTHGRLNPISYGMNMKEMAEVLMGEGCTSVLILDGGGSSTYCAKYEGESKLQTVNNPSDGSERLISSSLMFTSSAKPTGEFDHAAITPNNLVYTPDSSVQFEAKGVDSSGSSADLPGSLTWKLSEDSESYGSIDKNGEFTSNGKTGEVNVQLLDGDTKVGESKIVIAEPDSISFKNEEVSLGFNKSSDLGLVVKWKGRDVNYKDGDFTWTLTPDDKNAKPEDMGSFKGNIFTSSEGKSVNGHIRCTYKGSDGEVSGEVYAIIGRLPTVAMDFEDVTAEDGTVTSAEDYWTNADTGKLKSINYGRGGKESIELVDVKDDEEHVRFGEKSLKINYDFTNISGTEGASVGYKTDEDNFIEGTPTAIGMWVYAPEGTPNLWLRIRVGDADGQIQNLNFTKEISKDKTELGGIDWKGWKYVEADLTNNKAPFKLREGEVIRLMCVPGTGMGYYLPDGTEVGDAERKGSIYVDNVRFVYGANVDDLEAPKAEYITINEEKLSGGEVFHDNVLTIKASLYDVAGSNSSGLDWDRIHAYVDGKEVAYQQAGELLQVSNLGLGNGDHKLKIVICDKFGNKTTETRDFTVKGERAFTTVSAERETSGDIYLGTTQKFKLTTNYAEKLATASADIQLSKAFGEDTFAVNFDENVDGKSSYNAETGILHLEASMKEGAAATGALTLAELSFKVPTTTPSGSRFRFAVNNGTYTTKEAETHQMTFGVKEVNEEVKASYVVSADPLTEGRSGQYIYAKDEKGEPADGVSIYLEDGTLLGKTGEAGRVRADKVNAKAGNYQIYAKKEDHYSFLTRIGVLPSAGNEEGVPTQITSVAVKDPETTKTVSWFSNPKAAEDTAILQVAKTSEYEEKGKAAFKNYQGTSKLHAFDGSADDSKNVTGLINKATADGLKPNVKYTYRVGDGNYWSQAETFVLKKGGTDTDLFVVGDAQSEDTTNIDKIMNNLKESGTDFAAGIQTGDLVDAAGVYSNWTSALDIFAKNSLTKNLDILHTIGNHELEGDKNLTAASEIFAMPDKNHYSVEYGNVYVATISYAFSKTQLQEDLEWLKKDAAKSDALWKVVVTHQPAYYTNTAGSNELMHELLPKAAEEAGIDFVFSGHDHSYARTQPLKEGKVDEKDGIVYYICGSTGEKSYTATDNKEFHFAKLSDDFDAIYLTVKATDKKFEVQTHELDGSVIDTYTKESTAPCVKDGHEYVRDEDGYLTCTKCSYASPADKYTGLIKDKETGKTMYLINGKPQTGWQVYGADKVYYFNEKGLSEKVTLEKDVKTTCTVRGYRQYECEKASSKDGREYRLRYAKPSGHDYNSKRICKKCGWKEVSLKDCTITPKYKTYLYTGKEIKPSVTVKYKTKTLASGYDYKLSYADNVDCGTMTITVTAITKFTGDAVNHKGSLAPGKTTKKVIIRPRAVEGLKASTLGNHTIKLTWEKAAGVDGYRVYRWNSSKDTYVLYKTITDEAATEYTARELSNGTTYTFKVCAYAMEDGNRILGKEAYVKGMTKPYKVSNIRLSTASRAMTVRWNKTTCTGYHIRYSTSKDFSSYKTVTVKGSSNLYRKISSLTKGKRYYVKVRGYKAYSGYPTVYGTWSDIKSIVIK